LKELRANVLGGKGSKKTASSQDLQSEPAKEQDMQINVVALEVTEMQRQFLAEKAKNKLLEEMLKGNQH